jgi:hypothetical protein
MVELISCISFEHAVGILSCQYQLQTFCYSDNTCGIPLRARRGGGDGGDPVALVGGALDPPRRHLQQAFRSPLAVLGGQAWGWRAWLPPLPCTALLLLLFPLLVGHGGEELGGGTWDASGFVVFRGFPSTQALRRCAWWSSSLQSGELPWGRQAALHLKMTSPFNNF